MKNSFESGAVLSYYTQIPSSCEYAAPLGKWGMSLLAL